MWIFIPIAIVFLLVFLFRKRWNTFVLIARNTTYIHEILSTEFKNRFPNVDVLLATCGVIDARKYVMEGSLTVGEIATGVLTSKCGECSLNLIKLDITDNPTYHFFVRQPDLLYFVYFVMQLQALIFRVDTNVPTENILSTVKSMKSVIGKEVIRTQHKYKTRGAPPWLKAVTYAFMNGQAFAGLRDELGIIKGEEGKIGQVMVEAKQAVSSRGQHYVFVHQVLRDLFFDMPQDIIAILSGEGRNEALLDLWQKVGEQVGKSGQIAPDCLSCEIRMLDDDIVIALITLPVPEFMCEAHFVALVYRSPSPEHEGITRFIVLERGAGSRAILCEWESAHEHGNMGPIEEPTLQIFYEEVCNLVQSVSVDIDDA